MEHNINLNIHYTAPAQIWDKIGKVYSQMPYWDKNASDPQWTGNNISLWASAEPGGIQIAGIMPDDIWEIWYALLKKKLTEALGYEIGEPEDGYTFVYYE